MDYYELGGKGILISTVDLEGIFLPVELAQFC
jgi:hypothetical protein